MPPVGADKATKEERRQLVKSAKAALASAVSTRDREKLEAAIAHAREVRVNKDIIEEAEEVLATLQPVQPTVDALATPAPTRSDATLASPRPDADLHPDVGPAGAGVGDVAGDGAVERRHETKAAVDAEQGEPVPRASTADVGTSQEGWRYKPSVVSWSSYNRRPVLMDVSPGVFFVYRGVRYGSLHELVEATRTDPAQQNHQLSYDLASSVIESKVRTLFRMYAQGRGAMTADEYRGLAASLAAELGYDPLRFSELCVEFYRFDINDNGMLDEEESVLLGDFILRRYLNAQRPRRNSRTRLNQMIEIGFKNLEDHYELNEKVGEGGQGSVFLALEVDTGQTRAVKCYDKSNMQAIEDVRQEFSILRSLDHPKIQRMYDIFEDRKNVYVIAEPFYGGNLDDLMENAMDACVSVTSTYLAKAVYQVLQGVAYLHSNYILHCDLKATNLMVISKELEDIRDPSVVVIDFGVAQYFGMGLGEAPGTPGYMPPEVWTKGVWTPKGDVHALGVVMFQLFAMGEKCFPGWGKEEVMKSTLNALPRYEAIGEYWGRRCTDLPPLLNVMLSKNPTARPCIRKCLDDPFFRKRVQSDDPNEEPIAAEVIAALGELQGACKLQRAILTDLAARQNLAELKVFYDAFGKIDADNDGVVTAEEARVALADYLDEASLEQTVSRLVGPEGKLAYTAFMGQLLLCKAADENRVLWREFRQLDTDGTGYLDRDETARLLERPALAQAVGGRDPSALMDLMDFDGDGHILFEEFVRALSGGADQAGPGMSA